MIKILKQTIVTEFVDTETGETTVDSREFLDDSVKKSSPKKASSSRKKKNEWDDDPRPIVVREDNKLILNEAAVNTLGVTDGDRVNIKMQVINRKRYPVIGTDEAFGSNGGNLVTKSFTIRYGGKNNEELAKFGYIFVLEAHPKTEGLFLMKNPDVGEETETLEEATAISVQEELDELNSNLTDEEAEEVDDLNFDLDFEDE